MSTLDEWLSESGRALGLDPGSVPADLRNELLDLTRDVAHGIARIAGPLTCYQAGLAVGRGAAPAAVMAALTDLVRAHGADGDRSAPEGGATGPTAPGGDTTVPAAQEADPIAPDAPAPQRTGQAHR